MGKDSIRLRDIWRGKNLIYQGMGEGQEGRGSNLPVFFWEEGREGRLDPLPKVFAEERLYQGKEYQG